MSEEHAQIKTDHGMPPIQAEAEYEGHRVGPLSDLDVLSILITQVYIANLPFDATEEKVREFVAPVGGEM
jgi:hypothetical protein